MMRLPCRSWFDLRYHVTSPLSQVRFSSPGTITPEFFPAYVLLLMVVLLTIVTCAFIPSSSTWKHRCWRSYREQRRFETPEERRILLVLSYLPAPPLRFFLTASTTWRIASTTN